jgi:thioredoxin reductase (NADPH)
MVAGVHGLVTMDTLIILAVFAGLFLVFVFPYVLRARRQERQNTERLKATEAAGLNEPPSLHPLVDPSICLGSGACVAACPEGDILGLINNRPALLSAARCVGHGQCAAACPVQAITLVFGTERRGVDIPHVQGNFETNVPGLFIAGELGGMGLIRNALRQGVQAVQGIAATSRLLAPVPEDALDVLVVGAGPAGIAAGLEAKAHELRHVVIEQEQPGGAVRHYPRQKLVMTEPMQIPLYGAVDLRQAGKEDLLELWDKVIEKTGLQISSGERLVSLKRDADDLWQATTTVAHYRARAVVLAIGRRGTPRRLGVPGEDLEKVAYRLLEPEHFVDSDITVVGGGNSAVEVAGALAMQGQGNRVHLLHRGAALGRANETNRQLLDTLCKEDRLSLLLDTQITHIHADRLDIAVAGQAQELPNDFVFVCVGGQLPVGLLKECGIHIETKFGEA